MIAVYATSTVLLWTEQIRQSIIKNSTRANSLLLWTSSTAAQTTPAPQANTNFTYTGSAPTVNPANGQFAVVLAPNTLTSNSLSGTAFPASNAPASSQIQQSNYGGAFTTLASSSVAVSLTKGSTIADINGAAGYVAIGRWTNGSDSSGGNYNANQGAHYAVGTPLTLTPSTGTLSCTTLMATATTSATGSVVPGALVSATATLDLSTLNLTNFSATVTIGSDTAATFTRASVEYRGVCRDR